MSSESYVYSPFRIVIRDSVNILVKNIDFFSDDKNVKGIEVTYSNSTKSLFGSTSIRNVSIDLQKYNIEFIETFYDSLMVKIVINVNERNKQNKKSTFSTGGNGGTKKSFDFSSCEISSILGHFGPYGPNNLNFECKQRTNETKFLQSLYPFEPFNIIVKDSKKVFVKELKFYNNSFLTGIEAVYCNGSSSLYGYKFGESTSIDLNKYNIYRIDIKYGAIIDGITFYTQEKLNMSLKNKFLIGGTGGDNLRTFNFSSKNFETEKYDLLSISGFYGNIFGNTMVSLKFQFRLAFIIKSKK